MAEVAASTVDASALHVDEPRYLREGLANRLRAAVQPKLAVLNILTSRAQT